MEEINVFYNSTFLGTIDIKENAPIDEISLIAQDLLPKMVEIKKETYLPHKFIKFSN